MIYLNVLSSAFANKLSKASREKGMKMMTDQQMFIISDMMKIWKLWSDISKKILVVFNYLH